MNNHLYICHGPIKLLDDEIKIILQLLINEAIEYDKNGDSNGASKLNALIKTICYHYAIEITDHYRIPAILSVSSL